MSKMTKTAKNNTKTVPTFRPDQELSQTVRTRIMTLLTRRNGSWDGTMTELSRAITTGIKRTVPSNWPKTPSLLRVVVNTVVPSLRSAGVSVKFGRTTDHSRTRFVRFTQNG